MAHIRNARRTCPECGQAFVAHHGRQQFCTVEHKASFWAVSMRRGKVAMAFVQTWRMGKSGRTEDTSYALQQISKMADLWNAEDRKAGRRPELVVAAKRAAFWNATDLCAGV